MSDKSAASSDKAAAAADKPAEAAKPAKRGKLIPILVAVVVIAAGGGGAFWWFSRGAHAAAKHEPARQAAESGGGVVPLEPFLVNLADPGGSRYLRTTLKLVVADEKAAERVAKNEVAMTRVRSAILELLTTRTADQLVTADGKTSLKHAIAERVTPIVGVPVADVLFADFVVQF